MDRLESYLQLVSREDRAILVRINRAGLTALQEYLDAGVAVAFVGAGASSPLYPLWTDLIRSMIDAASDRLTERAAKTCSAAAASDPDAVIDIIRKELGRASYRELLRELFQPRRDSGGRTWTPAHELIVRMNFRGIVTTNFDTGIVDARMRARPQAVSTGFTSWTNEDGLDRWRRGDIFTDCDLPVLYAHGQHNDPDNIVLASTEYRRAYAGRLERVLAGLFDAGHLVWVGFSFADQRIKAILREIAEASGPVSEPGIAPRHVALLPWNPHGPATSGEPADPEIIRDLMELQYGCHVVLYPAPEGDHSALQLLLEEFTDPRFPPVVDPPAVETPSHRPSSDTEHRTTYVMNWVHGGLPVEHFVGRADELSRLDRWADDPDVRLIGVTAWGGAGKTSLVTHWLSGRTSGLRLRGVFGWSFYENPSATEWAEALISWAGQTFDVALSTETPIAARVLAVAQTIPIAMVLDGLEVMQEGPVGTGFGLLLDGVLRDALTGLCRLDHPSLVLLTSRFPFADLERFNGTSVRMLEVGSLSADEGASLIAATGASWLPLSLRRELVSDVAGHALALQVLAAALVKHPLTADVSKLRRELGTSTRVNQRVTKVLDFYGDLLSEEDRTLLSIVSMFQRPVGISTILTLGAHEVFSGRLAGWRSVDVDAAVQRMAGLLSRHSEGGISAHPLIRDAFRPHALSAGAAPLVSELSLAELPGDVVATRDEALRVIEIIELLLDADAWRDADDVYRSRTSDGEVWKHLPEVRLGQRCASGFVGTPERRAGCVRHLSRLRSAYYLNEVGLFASMSGDLELGVEFLREACAAFGDISWPSLLNLSECYAQLGELDQAVEAAQRSLDLRPVEAIGSDRAEALGYLAWSRALGGETIVADKLFIEANQAELESSGFHLGSLIGTWWATFLLHTGRSAAARVLTERNLELCVVYGWTEDVARCKAVLAKLSLLDGDAVTARTLIDESLRVFRDGNLILDVLSLLPDAAECSRSTGDLNTALIACGEAVEVAGPRGARVAQASALSARARIRADLFRKTGTGSVLGQARDDADHALRVATGGGRKLAWQELEALEVHASLDQQIGDERGWAQRATAARTALVPSGLAANPIIT